MNLNIDRLSAEPLGGCSIEKVNDFCGKYLGEGLYTAKSLSEIAHAENHYFYVVSDGDEIAAVFYCYCGSAEEAAADITEKILGFCRKGEKVGVCRSIAVDPRYRGTGLSEKLLERFCGLLFDRCGVERIFILAWIKGGFIPAGKLLDSAGFSALCTVSRPWYGIENMVCPFCKGRCSCDGKLYMKLRESE